METFMSWYRTGLPCPKCPSSDAYAEGDKGSKCFSCGYFKPLIGNSLAIVSYDKVDNIPFDGKLPWDCQITAIPTHLLEWYTQYLDTKYMADYCSYSKFYNRLIFPIYDRTGQLMCWQGRAIDREPKWLNKGFKQPWGRKYPYVSRYAAQRYVVTEDIVSAIKVAEAGWPAIALLGSSINQEYANFLLSLASTFIIWLDNDAAGQHGCHSLFDKLKLCAKVNIIETKYDPKCYSLTRIKEILVGG
jgi:hypothetical protein